MKTNKTNTIELVKHLLWTLEHEHESISELKERVHAISESINEYDIMMEKLGYTRGNNKTICNDAWFYKIYDNIIVLVNCYGRVDLLKNTEENKDINQLNAPLITLIKGFDCEPSGMEIANMLDKLDRLIMFTH